jgi:alcohol dehydrogenase (NADP+)
MKGAPMSNEDHTRRAVLASSAVAAVALSLKGTAMAAETAPSAAQTAAIGPEQVRAYAFHQAHGHAAPIDITRRAVGPDDVKMEILYAGICHSDLHAINSDWGPSTYPVVPGHEIVGRVTAVGANVTRFKEGDIGGVGCMVDSCGHCQYCEADREQICENGTTFTYGAPDKVSGGLTYGGYSTGIVVKEHFVVSVPDGMDLSRVAPIMCAGITTFSPLQHWNPEPGQKVGVVGIGGLGHMAVKLAVARGAQVFAFTTTPAKIEAIRAMGAVPVLSTDAEAMAAHRNSLDLAIATVPDNYDMKPFMDLLKVDTTLVNVGQLGEVGGLSGMMMAFQRKSLAGSMIGGMAETQEVVNFCAEHDILPDVEVIRPDQIDDAIARIMDKDIQFRFVIDMTQA